ncbi:MFS transporter [Exophiala viscosa]|uniref:MFS transporter n=1 Tax=Exophiala viscosa TaxID=2486360 RepID=UPI002192D572|nr:MFS transporter [Exophiala viscosa]
MTGELHHDHVDVNEQAEQEIQIRPIQPPTGTHDMEKIPTTTIPDPDDSEAKDRPDLTRIRSTVSHHDMHGVQSHDSSYVEINAAQYERFTERRKTLIACVLALCGFLAPISSTTILAAIPEVAATYNTSGSIINLSNALYLVFMGLSPSLWGPLSTIYGRRWICIVTAILFFAFSVGTALAPNLASYFIFRMLTAYQGTSFLIVGTSCLGDIYTPTQRATALGWFLSGTLIGPAFGPFIGGIIVTFRSWRDIFWLQSALGGLATILVVFALPETIPQKKIDELRDLPRKERTLRIAHWVSPIRVTVLLFSYPNLILAGLASSSLVWNMYSLLTPIRYVLNPRFHLTSPIQSGLFYIAPGCGYLLGTFFGGRWADHIVKKWILKKGRRVPEDRLRSCYAFVGFVIPACMLIYGWSVEKKVGGIPLPVMAMFVQGVAQLFCFPSLNTYCLDVMQAKGLSAEVVAGNYMIRYLFSAAGSAVCLPAIEKIGVGWFSSVSALFLVVSAVSLWATTVWGEDWRRAVDRKKKARKESKISEREEKEGGQQGV